MTMKSPSSNLSKDHACSATGHSIIQTQVQPTMVQLQSMQWRIQGFFWLPGTPPPPGHVFFYNPVGDTLTGIDLTQTSICDFWKPPLRPTLDTPLQCMVIMTNPYQTGRAFHGNTFSIDMLSPLGDHDQ